MIEEKPEPATRISSLPADQLYRTCTFDGFSFETTDDLETLDHLLVGQDRALTSAEFGIKMQKDGYNMYALGPENTDKRNLLEELIKKEAAEKPVPRDWCYVCNFDNENKPVALELPAGRGVKFRDMMNSFCEDLPNILTSALESEEYQNRRQTVEEEWKAQEQQTFADLQEQAQEKGLTILSTPIGYSFVPIKEDRIMTNEEIKELSDEEKQRLENEAQKFQKELQKILRQAPKRQRTYRSMREELNKEFAEFSVRGLIEEVENEFSDLPEILEYLKQVQQDIILHVEQIVNPGSGNPFVRGSDFDSSKSPAEHPVLWRYTVNVMVDNTDTEGAPVIYEDNPTFINLIGRIEHLSEMGTLTTDFTYIRPGALLRANGGYLLLDVNRILTHPFSWEGLKRVLQSKKLKIESPGDMYGLFSTVTLEPKPIDLDIKVVLMGSRLLYYLLCAYDADFKTLFKVDVDFADEIDWTPDNQNLFARIIAMLAQKHELKPLNRSGVARVVEHASRLVSDNEKMSTHFRDVIDLLREADFWAQQEGRRVINREAVQKAIDQQLYRSGRLRDQVQESILRKTIFIDTDGVKTGQVNGLSVIMLGSLAFGHPTRITARVKVGRGEVINIEREVEMSGPIHSKGVLILSSFLGARYAIEKPLSLSASLVFEQSYGGVEGDSASSTELYALLSAIAEVPLKQSIAVTGSVNQHGDIQPIGGVNEKIEGFFDICSKRGLTGDQGVLIPDANIKNLVLKQEVVGAVGEGKFHIYAIKTINEGMEILTGIQMGSRDDSGRYPKGSINFLVEKKLNRFASIRREFGTSIKENGKAENT
ncbi:Lon protease family protein [Fodinibius sediminis]|uniref:endopeptidase La n=1 Tax=Fodinibius sediminis TaxID=1214077 RepID=A0A521CME7_9BACT|nr:ATP-binding protein [Fodinibius sediminis]SMO60619.1 lon-related putative ATP-dependent protease [Fodinibius sediminis]